MTEETKKTRQYGKLGQVKLDEKGNVDEEAERKRLYQNQKSREARARRKLLAERIDSLVIGDEYICDKWGINKKDEERYRRCCSSSLYNSLSYVKMRTGLSLKQLSVLQERTGLYPVPPVDKKKANADYKRRKELGDTWFENVVK